MNGWIVQCDLIYSYICLCTSRAPASVSAVNSKKKKNNWKKYTAHIAGIISVASSRNTELENSRLVWKETDALSLFRRRVSCLSSLFLFATVCALVCVCVCVCDCACVCMWEGKQFAAKYKKQLKSKDQLTHQRSNLPASWLVSWCAYWAKKKLLLINRQCLCSSTVPPAPSPQSAICNSQLEARSQ